MTIGAQATPPPLRMIEPSEAERAAARLSGAIQMTIGVGIMGFCGLFAFAAVAGLFFTGPRAAEEIVQILLGLAIMGGVPAALGYWLYRRGRELKRRFA